MLSESVREREQLHFFEEIISLPFYISPGSPFQFIPIESKIKAEYSFSYPRRSYAPSASAPSSRIAATS